MKKDNFKVSLILGKHINLGSVVYLIDGSYMVKKGDKNPSSLSVMTSEEGGDFYQVIDMNKPFPTNRKQWCNYAVPINNLKIRNLRTGDIYYCSELNVMNISSGWEYFDNLELEVCTYKNTTRPISELFSTKKDCCKYYKPAVEILIKA